MELRCVCGNDKFYLSREIVQGSAGVKTKEVVSCTDCKRKKYVDISGVGGSDGVILKDLMSLEEQFAKYHSSSNFNELGKP